MESTIMMTGLTLGGMLIFPMILNLILEFIKHNWTIIASVAVAVFAVAVLAPYSPAADALWQPLSQIPDQVGYGLALAGQDIEEFRLTFSKAFGRW